MFSSDGRYIIVFNGEIYNYREIREELKARGHSFNSNSDTEVLLNAYVEWKERCLDKFVGMFAFVIYDTRDGDVFFARDHLGIKPLFIWEDSYFIILTSEIKALLPYTNLEPEAETFNEYLVFRSLPGERTMFKNVKSLPPGNMATLKNDIITRSQYFKLEQTIKEDNDISFEEACEQTQEVLSESISIHLRSDVELGIQLSGGVDSSLITVMASGISGKRIHSFSISFDESEYDESEFQKRVSARYNTEHHDFRMSQDIFVKNIEMAIWHYEHPLNDPNSVATLHLALMARQFVTVILSGEGADESFLGYNKFLPEMVRKMWLRNLIHKNPTLRRSLAAIWPFKKGSSLINITKYPPAMLALSYAKADLIDRLLDGRFQEMTPRSQIANLAGGDTLKEILLQDEICDLPQWLWRADRMGMAASLEFRVPFCTQKMFEHANSIPYHVRLNNGEQKAILKKLAEKYIDNDQIYRKKIGFGVPIENWFAKNGPYRSLFDDTMNSEQFRSKGSINQNLFFQIYKAHQEGSYKEKNSAFLWTYLNIELWHRIFFSGRWKNLSSGQSSQMTP